MAISTDEIKTDFEILEGKYKKTKKRKLTSWLWSLAFAASCVVLCSIVGAISTATVKGNQGAYMKSVAREDLIGICEDDKYVNDPECATWYERNLLGIENNIALAGLSWECDANKAFQNDNNGLLAHRDESSGLLIIEGSGGGYSGTDITGEIIVFDGDVFFINESKENNIYLVKNNTSKSEKVIDEPVAQFAIFGDYIFYRTYDEQVKRYSFETGSVDLLAENVQRLFICGGLVLQNESKVINMTYDGTSSKVLLEDAIAVGADYSRVYYTGIPKSADKTDSETEIAAQVSLELSAIKVSSGQTEKIEDEDSIVRAVYATSEGLVVDRVGGEKE